MDTLQVLNTLGIILVGVGIIASLLGLLAPGFREPARHRFNHALSAGVLFLVLGIGVLVIVYVVGIAI